MSFGLCSDVIEQGGLFDIYPEVNLQ